jgi:hypothetical protein
MGFCACPCCLIPKASFGILGLFRDMGDCVASLRSYSLARVNEARDFIYNWGHTVDSSKVQATLGQGLWVPIVVSLAS